MQQVERINDFEESLRAALRGHAVTQWHAMPGIVRSYDAQQGTVVVEIAIQMQITDASGNVTWETIKPLPDVPVVYLGGGNFVATFPIQDGDEALVVFADRCIDGWWAQGGIQQQLEPRIHDLSDGFAFVGPRSQANMIKNVSTTAAQIRSLDGSTLVEVGSGEVTVKATTVNVQSTTTNITGKVNIHGDVAVTGAVTATGEGTFNSIPVSTHLHGGVSSGSSDTSTPIA